MIFEDLSNFVVVLSIFVTMTQAIYSAPTSGINYFKFKKIYLQNLQSRPKVDKFCNFKCNRIHIKIED